MATSAATSLIFVLGYRAQPLQHQVFGLFATQSATKGDALASAVPKDEPPSNFSDRILKILSIQRQAVSPEAQLITDDVLLRDVIQQLNIRDFSGNPVSPQALRKRISLSPQGSEGMTRIALEAPHQVYAEQVVNQLMQSYVEYYSADTPAKSVSFSQVIQPHLVNSERLIKQAQQASSKIQLGGQGNSSVSTNTRAGDQTPELQTMDISIRRQLSTIDADLSVLAEILTTAGSSRSPLIKQIIALGQARKALLFQLRQALDQPRDSKKLSPQLEQLESRALMLQKELALTQQIYAKFLENEQTPWSISQRSQNPVRIVSPATISPQGVRPFLPWFISGGLLTSLGVGALAVLFREKSASFLDSLPTIYQTLPLPIFGIIPHYSARTLSLQSLARHENQERLISDNIMSSYDQALNHMVLASLDRMPQVLAFVSIRSREGASLTVANLAYLMAQRGKKVLVLDANLLKPGQPDYWNTAPKAGLGDCIAGEVQVGKALQRLHPNLDLLQAGHTARNIHVLLNSPGISLFIEEFRTRYDHILVDTPALENSVHGYLIANNADATLLLINPTKVKPDHIEYLRETLNRSAHNVWGMLINDYNRSLHGTQTANLLVESQWDATIRLQQQRATSDGELEVSTLSAMNPSNNALVQTDEPDLNPISAARQRREKQEPHLYSMPLDELHRLVNALWEDWEHDLILLLEQEEELIQQRRQVHHLKSQITRGNPYLKLSGALHFDEEQEKLQLLANAYIGQRPALLEAKEDLKFYLEILFARTDAEQVPSIQS